MQMRYQKVLEKYLNLMKNAFGNNKCLITFTVLGTNWKTLRQEYSIGRYIFLLFLKFRYSYSCIGVHFRLIILVPGRHNLDPRKSLNFGF